ncbi:ATP synthase A chain family protein [[Clostridium] sordellii ATCC 9714]|nr:ATP synthase A chain family protein [[Clostridium] sordellii ATCC 9714] [Paeniclostridium sordellii ATCC 9714]
MSQAKFILYVGNFKLSDTVITSWLILAGLALVSYLLTRNLKKVPTSKVQIFLEFVVGGFDKFVKDTMGPTAVKELPFIVPYLGSLSYSLQFQTL